MLLHLFVLAFSTTPTFAEAKINPRFERLLETETEDIKNIRSGILFLQKQQAEQSGTVLRGTHAKGICVKGELTILDLDSESPLKRGMFSLPATYPTTLRFANAEGKILPDQEPDVRAVSLAVETPVAISNNQGRMDFALNNAPTFPINDAHVFGNLMVVAEHGLVSGGFKVGFSGLKGIKKAFDLGEQQKTPATVPYQAMSYWSDVPFQLGEDQAVKYKLTPCAGNSAHSLTSDPDTLSLELKRHVSESPLASCFDLQVQVLDTEKMTNAKGRRLSAADWIENATIEWNEQQAPFVSVATLTLLQDSMMDAAECESLRIDVTKNSNEIHRGLGSINRARAAGESASAANR